MQLATAGDALVRIHLGEVDPRPSIRIAFERNSTENPVLVVVGATSGTKKGIARHTFTTLSTFLDRRLLLSREMRL